MSAPDVILQLIELFDRNIDAYRSQKYNEATLRQEFINPFFEALGWDIYNKLGYAEAYKDVIHEDAIKIGGFTKAPDYCFRTGGTRKFFVEAKKPYVNIRENPEPAYQLRRYAWSAKLPLSILTDFEELAVYDCRVKPAKTDSPATARTLMIHFSDYPERWEEMAEIFSKDSVYRGSFDKYVESTKLKRGTAEVDTAFLKEIESWRDALARNIALRNPRLAQRDLNYAVQATIDRIIFLRICEDRGVEDYGKLMALQNGEAVYQRLCHLFEEADQRYNSGLFHFHKEKGRPNPDELTLNLSIDDKPLKEIFKKLYYPDSPYEFSVLSADILGQVYEQFLGKVIRLTTGHQAKVEDKPEVKKAGGVYYTPTYIVDYIVKNTVGKLLEEGRGTRDTGHGIRDEGNTPPLKKKPTPKEASKLRILDPACGSGSFLIGAYQYLLDWHLNWYITNDPKKWAVGRNPTIYQASSSISHSENPPQSPFDKGGGPANHSPLENGQIPTFPPLKKGGRGDLIDGRVEINWKLTTAEKKRILLNNIYGVDIDPQAVEVTKLSLLLKVLEGENEQTIASQLAMFHERALPDLASNIKCGNSLIGPDYDNQQLSFLDEEERYRINVFDWEAEFPSVFARSEATKQSPSGRVTRDEGREIQGRGTRDEGHLKGRPTSHVPSPNPGFDAVIGNPPYVRQEMLGEFKDYLQKHYEVYHGMADLYSYFIERGVSLLNKAGLFGFIVSNKWMRANYGKQLRKWMKERSIQQIVDFGDLPVFQKATTYPCILIISNNSVIESFKAAEIKTLKFLDLSEYVNDNEFAIKRASLSNGGWSLVDDRTQKLLEKLRITGIPLGEYVKGKIYYGIKTGLNEAFVIDEKTREKLISEDPQSAEIIKPYLIGEDLVRYQIPFVNKYLIFMPKGWTNVHKTGDATLWFRDKYPRINNHLERFSKAAEKRYDKGDFWWELRACDYYDKLEKSKISWGNLCRKASFTTDRTNSFVNAPACILGSDSSYLLGLLNSTTLWYFLKAIAAGRRGGFIEAKPIYVSQLPIRTIDFSDPADKVRHDRMVSLVDRMLSLNKQLQSAKTTHDRAILQRQISATDNQIDKLVYELYDLTPEEIQIVEKAL